MSLYLLFDAIYAVRRRLYCASGFKPAGTPLPSARHERGGRQDNATSPPARDAVNSSLSRTLLACLLRSYLLLEPSSPLLSLPPRIFPRGCGEQTLWRKASAYALRLPSPSRAAAFF